VGAFQKVPPTASQQRLDTLHFDYELDIDPSDGGTFRSVLAYARAHRLIAHLVNSAVAKES